MKTGKRQHNNDSVPKVQTPQNVHASKKKKKGVSFACQTTVSEIKTTLGSVLQQFTVGDVKLTLIDVRTQIVYIMNLTIEDNKMKLDYVSGLVVPWDTSTLLKATVNRLVNVKFKNDEQNIIHNIADLEKQEAIMIEDIVDISGDDDVEEGVLEELKADKEKLDEFLVCARDACCKIMKDRNLDGCNYIVQVDNTHHVTLAKTLGNIRKQMLKGRNVPQVYKQIANSQGNNPLQTIIAEEQHKKHFVMLYCIELPDHEIKH